MSFILYISNLSNAMVRNDGKCPQFATTKENPYKSGYTYASNTVEKKDTITLEQLLHEIYPKKRSKSDVYGLTIATRVS